MVLCFECNGTGKVSHTIFSKNSSTIETTCEMCNGKGKIANKKIDWIIQGMKLKEDRLNQGITIQKAARLLQVEPDSIDRMERGIVKPLTQYDLSEN